MVTAVIIDDERASSNYLKGLIGFSLPEVILKGTASSVSEGVALIRSTSPDIVFLDIELQTGTGFDLLTQLGNVNFSVIFITAYEKYAIRAIKFAALDYLLKPIVQSELVAAVHKSIDQRKGKVLDENMSVLLSNIQKQKNPQKIAISSMTGLIFMNINEIIFLQSDGPYTTIHSINANKIISSKHLKEYDDLLVDFGFFRVHRSYLVNLAEIKQFVRADGGYLIMSNGDKVDVADSKKASLIAKIADRTIAIP
jgi:two-component system LytT family response regulator